MACVICNSHEFRFLFEKDGFRIERCRICDLVQVTNMPTADLIPSIYDKAFFDDQYAGLTDTERKQKYVYLNFENKLQQIEARLGRTGRLLDVGCSFGFFLDVARQRGWSVQGLEISEYAASYARSRLNLSVQTGAITDAAFPDSYFDVITMWEVVEHLADPVKALQHLSQFLTADGLIAMGTPNVDSYMAMIQRTRWRNFEPPIHLLYFSPPTMNRLLQRCNLRMIGHESAVPYEKYFRRFRLYAILDRLKISDKSIYYACKAASPAALRTLPGLEPQIESYQRA